MPMNILLTGGTGFIGTALTKALQKQGHQLIILTRKPDKIQLKCRAIQSFEEISSNEEIHAVINLAGEGIADRRWTVQRKQLLETSRVDLTADLIANLRRLKQKPQVLISGSAVGYYGDCQDKLVTEFTDPHDEFSHRLCAAWEGQALRAKVDGIRVCIIRTGIVIGPGGGFLKKLLPSFRLGLGAQLGNGKQWLSWIHLTDLINIILFLLTDNKQQGIYNATAPNPVTNKIFTKMLGAVLHRPTFLVLSKVLLKLVFGELSQLLLTGQRVFPKRLEQEGFEFQYSAIKPALQNACSENS